MSLSPTLWTERKVQAGVGLASSAGLAISIFSNVVTPTTGAVSVSGQSSAMAPTVIQTAGPNAQPARAFIRLENGAVTLQKTVVVYPELPAGPSNDNDLTPTILLGNSSSAGTPGVGYVSTGGLQPTLLRDNAAFAFIPGPVAMIAEGLVPTVFLPAGQEGTTTPRLGNLQTIELAPKILGSLDVTADAGGITITGLVPTLAYASGWRTVALTGDAVWTDVTRAS